MALAVLDRSETLCSSDIVQHCRSGYAMSACMQDAAGKVQGAAQTQYDYAKDTASNLADKAQGHAQGAHGQAKVSMSHL